MKPKSVEQSRLYPRRLTSRSRPPAGVPVLWIWCVAGHAQLIASGRMVKRRPADLEGGFLGGQPTHWAPWPIDFPAIPATPLPLPKFSVGDEVKWVSQSGGYRKAKTGIVVACIPAGETPADVGLRRRGKFGGRRGQDSYLVSCNKVVYWPRTAWVQATGRKFADWLAEVKSK